MRLVNPFWFNKDYYAVMIVGDSISRGNSTAVGPTPTTNTVYQWDAGNSNLRAITNADLLEPVAAGGTGSEWPAFGIDFYRRTGRNPVFINCGVGGSRFNYPGQPDFSWYTDGNLYDNAKTKTDNALAYLGKSRPDVIICILGINDVTPATDTLSYTYVQSLIERLSSDYPGTRIIMTSPSSFTIDTTAKVVRLYTMRKYVKRAQFDYANVELGPSFSNFTVWDTTLNLFNDDNVHLNYDGNLTLGQRLSYQCTLSLTLDKVTRYALTNLYDDMNTTRISILDDFISGLRADGNLSELDVLRIFSNANGNNLNTTLDIGMLGATIFNNGPTISYDGVTFDGTNDSASIMPTQYLADKAVLASDFWFGVYVIDNMTAAGTAACLFGAREGNSSSSLLRLRQTTGNVIELYPYCATATTPITYSGDTAFQDNTLYSGGRDGSSGLIAKNETIVTNSACTFATPTANTTSMTVGGWNDQQAGPAVSQFINAKCGAVYFSKRSTFDLAAFKSRLDTFLSAWLTNSY